MKVTTLCYSRRYNLGEYEHEEFHVNAEIEEGDDHVEILAGLKCDIEKAHSGEADAGTQDAGPAKVEPKEDKPSKGKGKKSKPAPTTTPSKESQDSEDDGEEEIAEEEIEDAGEEEVAEEEVEEEKPTKKAPAKKLRKKNEVYDRDSQIHKKLFTKTVTGMSPKWRDTPAMAAKVKKVSMALEGEEFLDADGQVLEGFKAALKKAGIK